MFNFFGGGFPGAAGPTTDNGQHYSTLQVDKSASQADIKKAYRKLAMTHHPDKGGDEAKFKEISQAYEVLVDPEKRQNYDNAGKGFFNLFQEAKRPSADFHYPLNVQLEDLYNGCLKQLQLTRSVMCKACQGAGGKNIKKCWKCEGKGKKVIYRQLGPGLFQHYQALCEDCNGGGETIPDKCPSCQGHKTQKEQKTLTVQIQKGMQNGEKIVFRGEADAALGLTPGDVVVELVVKPHAHFIRHRDHLFYKKTITLLESLVGFDFNLEHLDKRLLQVTSTPGKVYPHQCCKAISGDGMPSVNQPLVRGNLYIQFLVVWPEKVDLAFWRQLLPEPPVITSATTALEKVTLIETDFIPPDPQGHEQPPSTTCQTQ